MNANTSSPASEPPRASRIVAIGGSAGALQALGRFFRAASVIRPDIAFVVVVHLAPDAESHLAELLARATPLVVSVIEDGAPIMGGHVYVISPKFSVSVFHGLFRLSPAVGRPEIPMPVDHLFKSLATDQHERAIGIVLTGATQTAQRVYA